MDKNERDAAVQSQTEYDRNNCEECIRLLDSLSESKGRVLNRAIAKFSVDHDVDCLLTQLRATEDLQPDQQVLVDYNRALALAKFKGDFEEAIDLLENRRSILPSSSGVIDDTLVNQMTLLLAILYLESRKDPEKAFNLLQALSEKGESSVVCSTEKMQHLKAKCYLQMGCSKVGKKEVKSISWEPLVRSCLEFQKGNFKKASKMWSSSVPDDEESLIHRNNEALLLFGSGSRNTAAFKLNSLLSHPSHKTFPPEILYNVSIIQLFTGNCSHARKMLLNLVPHFRHNPKIWLRLGESFMQEETRDFLSDIDLNRHKQDMVVGFLGEGENRKMVLNHCAKGRAIDSKSISRAKSCFLNGLNCYSSGYLSYSPSNIVSEQETSRLKIAFFLALSFIHLVTEDYTLAYSFAKAALSLSPKGYQKALANLYAGEALLLLDRVSDASGHFNPVFASDDAQIQTNNSSEETVVVQDFISSWYPNTARVTLIYNLSLSLTLRGDYEKATETLRQMGSNVSADTILPVHVILLAIYIQLQQGFIDGAKSLIRQHLPQFR